MKNALYLMLATVMVLSACSNNSSKNESNIEEWKALYESSKKLADYGTARVALNALVMLDSTNLNYKDSLTRLFIQSGNLVGGVALGQEIIDSNKADDKMLELMGFSYQQMAELDRSTAIFTDLLNKTGDYRYAVENYKNLMFKGNMKHIDSMTNALLALAQNDPRIGSTLIRFEAPFSQSEQFIPLEPAVLCLRGQFALNFKNDAATAQRYFKKAIEKSENFEVPYYELQRMGKL